MNLTPEIEFIAMDYLETMLEEFLQNLTDAINEEANGDSDKVDQYWSESFETFEQDVPLIIFLTISIAAKFVDGGTCFGLQKVQEFVQKVTGNEYLLEDLKQHEFNLFKLMKFKVERAHALDTMEQLMKMVYDKVVLKGIGLKYFLHVGVLALRFAYLEKNRIYEGLQEGTSDPEGFKMLTRDKILLGAAVVFASSRIVNAPKEWIKKILKQLSDTCLREEKDIFVLGQAIMKAFMD